LSGRSVDEISTLAPEFLKWGDERMGKVHGVGLIFVATLAACGGGDGSSTQPGSVATGSGTGTGTAVGANGITIVTPTTSIPASEISQSITVTTNLTTNPTVSVDVDALAKAIADQLGPIPIYPPSSTATTPPGSVDGPVETPIAQARFNFPRSVAMNGQGTLFVADSGNHTIRKISRSGVITTIAGQTGQSGLVDGPGNAARFSYLTSITVDDGDNLYVTDDNTVRKITQEGNVTTIAGASQAGFADGIGVASRFSGPQGVFARGDGTLFIADAGNNAVRALSPTGAVSTLATGMTFPRALVLSGSTLYVADNSRIWSMAAAAGAVPSLIAGEPNLAVQSFANVDGVGANARFWPITGITMNPNGSLYVVSSMSFPKDSGGVSFIRRLTPDGRGLFWNVTTVSGAREIGYVDGPGTVSRFKFPVGITAEITGNMYVADAGNQVLRVVTTDGVTNTYAGKAGDKGSNY
jgi:hypothetical protein